MASYKKYLVGAGGTCGVDATEQMTAAATCGVHVMTGAEAERMRAAGHALPRRVRLQKRSTLSGEERRYALRRLYVIRCLLDQVLIVECGGTGELEHMLRLYIRGGTLRFPWADDDPRKFWYNKWIAGDPRKIMPTFISQTWRSIEGAEQEGDFARIFTQFCELTMCKEMLDFLVRVLDLEEEEAAHKVPPGTAEAYIKEVVATGTREDVAPLKDGEKEMEYVGALGKSARAAAAARTKMAEELEAGVRAGRLRPCGAQWSEEEDEEGEGEDGDC